MKRLCLLAIAVLGAQVGAEDVQQDHPNVLFLFADDQSFDTVAAHGNEAILTPNLDRLAAGGISFRSTYFMGGPSPAVCSPTRANDFWSTLDSG